MVYGSIKTWNSIRNGMLNDGEGSSVNFSIFLDRQTIGDVYLARVS